jgi:hypothetical protein
MGSGIYTAVALGPFLSSVYDSTFPYWLSSRVARVVRLVILGAIKIGTRVGAPAYLSHLLVAHWTLCVLSMPQR